MSDKKLDYEKIIKDMISMFAENNATYEDVEETMYLLKKKIKKQVITSTPS